jgi:hypothetical protein
MVIAFGPRFVCLAVALILLLLSAWPRVGEPPRSVLLRVGLAFLVAALLFTNGG